MNLIRWLSMILSNVLKTREGQSIIGKSSPSHIDILVLLQHTITGTQETGITIQYRNNFDLSRDILFLFHVKHFFWHIIT